jgi:hypothetical protein
MKKIFALVAAALILSGSMIADTNLPATGSSVTPAAASAAASSTKKPKTVHHIKKIKKVKSTKSATPVPAK